MQDRRPGNDRRGGRQQSRYATGFRSDDGAAYNKKENRRVREFEKREDRQERERSLRGAEPDENRIEGRNAVIEAYRAGRTIEKLFLLEGPAEGAMQTVLRLAKDHHTPVRFLSRQRLDQLSQTGKHQGVIAQAAAFSWRIPFLSCSIRSKTLIIWGRSSAPQILPGRTA